MVAGDRGVALSVRVFDPPAADAPGLLLHHGLASSQHIWDLMLPASPGTSGGQLRRSRGTA